MTQINEKGTHQTLHFDLFLYDRDLSDGELINYENRLFADHTEFLVRPKTIQIAPNFDARYQVIRVAGSVDIAVLQWFSIGNETTTGDLMAKLLSLKYLLSDHQAGAANVLSWQCESDCEAPAAMSLSKAIEIQRELRAAH